MKIGIAGCGVVGSATAKAYEDFADEVRVHDADPNRSTHSLVEVLECDVVFVCLPTPQKPDSMACDLSAVNTFFASVPPEYRKANLVLRSTVPIGTTRKLSEQWGMPNLVHSPEFLTARTAEWDAKNPRVNIVGFPNGWTSAEQWVDSPAMALYIDRFGVKGTMVPMSSDESEAVKLFMNSFFAVKVAFWNECHALATALKLDFDTVRDAIVAEGRVHPLHTQVPGPDGFTGFGGSCLPKDLASFVYQMTLVASSQNHQPFPVPVVPLVTTAALKRNESIDRRRST